MGGCGGINPDHFLDFPTRRDLTGQLSSIEACLHAKTWLVGGNRIELPERADRRRDQVTPELLGDFTREGGDVVLTGTALAARLHECPCSALTYQEHPSNVITNQ